MAFIWEPPQQLVWAILWYVHLTRTGALLLSVFRRMARSFLSVRLRISWRREEVLLGLGCSRWAATLLMSPTGVTAGPRGVVAARARRRGPART